MGSRFRTSAYCYECDWQAHSEDSARLLAEHFARAHGHLKGLVHMGTVGRVDLDLAVKVHADTPPPKRAS